MTVRGAAWRLALFAAVMVVILSLVLTAIKRPVGGDSEAHDAIFTDANGLKVGDDVRMYGVQVGKVEGLSLEGDKAKVKLTVKTDTPIYDNSMLAIRYQSLTGQRYIDLQQQPKPGVRIPADARIDTKMTVPSFDVTSLFNGLKPVLATFSPEQVNQFTKSLLAVVEGDSSGVGAALDAIDQLSKYASNRQAVIGTVVRNMSELNEKVGGRQHYLVPLLAKYTDIYQSLAESVHGLADFADTGPGVFGPLDRLLGSLGITKDSGQDVNALIRTVFPDTSQAVELFSKLPALITALDNALPSTPASVKPVCSKGNAEVPMPLRVLIAGQQVAICQA
ncbi:MlaD family protein [Nocardia sp. NPDC049149]|uniref:MlaD family protein n=1 Tax=Nocardia sp. NPDC049149 TaxID=3364315 RepID=UPI00372084F7